MGIQTTPTRATRREHLRRALAAQSPLQHPPLRWWHVLLFVLASALGWLAIRAPGLLADMAAYPVGGWHAFVQARGAVIILATYALVFVRSYHALTGLGLIATILGLSLRIGMGQVTEEPLTVGYVLLLLALAATPVRVIVRPNGSDVVRQQAEEIRRLKGEVDEP